MRTSPLPPEPQATPPAASPPLDQRERRSNPGTPQQTSTDVSSVAYWFTSLAFEVLRGSFETAARIYIQAGKDATTNGRVDGGIGSIQSELQGPRNVPPLGGGVAAE